MTDDEPSPEHSRAATLAVLPGFLFIALALTMIVPAGWWYGNYKVLAQCDEGAKQYLKAPATYRRIAPVASLDALPRASTRGDTFTVEITYDAQNSFGVPIRSTGTCRVSNDLSWAGWELSKDDIKKMMGVR